MHSKLVYSRTRNATLLAGALGLCLCSLTAAAHAEAPAATTKAGTGSTAAASDAAANSGVVNINSASLDELDRLPGIGPSRAQAIVALRSQLKRFERLEDLMRVKGIGRTSFRNLRPLLTLEGATTLAKKSPARTPGGAAN